MTDDLIEQCGEALAFPDAAAAKLYEQARRRQRCIGVDNDWRELDLRRLPPSIRRAMATVYSQVRFAEAFGLLHVAKLLARIDEPWLRSMVAMQVADEARHVEFFSATIASLDMDAAPSPHLIALGRELDQIEATEEALLASQIVLESYAHVIFQGAARRARGARARAIRLPGSEMALRFVDCMTDVVTSDEARHVALGVLHLRNRWAALPPATRAHLRQSVERWSAMLDAVMLDIDPALAALGLDSGGLIAHAARSRHRQLLAAGWNRNHEAETA